VAGSAGLAALGDGIAYSEKSRWHERRLQAVRDLKARDMVRAEVPKGDKATLHAGPVIPSSARFVSVGGICQPRLRTSPTQAAFRNAFARAFVLGGPAREASQAAIIRAAMASRGTQQSAGAFFYHGATGGGHHPDGLGAGRGLIRPPAPEPPAPEPRAQNLGNENEGWFSSHAVPSGLRPHEENGRDARFRLGAAP
jgi:hypothetical protein